MNPSDNSKSIGELETERAVILSTGRNGWRLAEIEAEISRLETERARQSSGRFDSAGSGGVA